MGLDGDQGRSLETVRTRRLKGHYIPVVLVAENEKFYKEAFEVFAYNYLVMLVDRVVNKMESRTMEFMDLLNEPT